MHKVASRSTRCLLAVLLAASVSVPSGIALAGATEDVPDVLLLEPVDTPAAVENVDDALGGENAGSANDGEVMGDASDGGTVDSDFVEADEENEGAGDEGTADSAIAEANVDDEGDGATDEYEPSEEEFAEWLAENGGVQTMAEEELTPSGWVIDADGHCDIPAGTTSIPTDEFSGLESLKSVSIPDSVTSIKRYAFFGCHSLTQVVIPASVTRIGSSAFMDCTALTEIAIPDSVASIELDTFNHCTSLTKVAIPSSVTEIGVAAFRDCTSLAKVAIPDSVTSIEEGAFRGCTALVEIAIPGSVTSIEREVFLGCTSLAEVTLPESIEAIGNNAFSGCSSLKYYDQFKGISEDRLKELIAAGVGTGLQLVERPNVMVSLAYYTADYPYGDSRARAAAGGAALLETATGEAPLGLARGINDLVNLGVFPAPYGNDRKEIVSSPYSWNQCYDYTVSKDGEVLYSGHEPAEFTFDDENADYAISVTAKESPTVETVVRYLDTAGKELAPPKTRTLDYYYFPLEPAADSPWLNPEAAYAEEFPGYELVETLRPDGEIVYRYEKVSDDPAGDSTDDPADSPSDNPPDDPADGPSDGSETLSGFEKTSSGQSSQKGDSLLARTGDGVLPLAAALLPIAAFALVALRTGRKRGYLQ